MYPNPPCGAFSVHVSARWPFEIPSAPPAGASPVSRSAAEICSFDLTKDDGDEEATDDPPDPEGARIGRELDAHALFGPLIRRHGLTGQRYAQVTVQLAGGLLGLAIADSLDENEVQQGRPATNRAKLLADSPEARVAAAHQAEITAVFQQASALS